MLQLPTRSGAGGLFALTWTRRKREGEGERDESDNRHLDRKACLAVAYKVLAACCMARTAVCGRRIGSFHNNQEQGIPHNN